MTVRLLHGDCREIMATMEPNSVDAIVTDPPAGISFMGKQWDSDKGGRDAWIAWLTEIMAEACRVAKPGAHAVVWALPRTSGWTHRALEDAGWEIRDCITHMFGSGFPKSLDVSKAIDKRRDDTTQIRMVCRFLRAAIDTASLSTKDVADRFGFNRRMVEHWAARDTDSQPTLPRMEQWEQLRTILGFGDDMDEIVIEYNRRKGTLGEAWHQREVIGKAYRLDNKNGVVNYGGGTPEGNYDITAPATPDSERWQGWGTALKPGGEHWYLARKPFPGTVASNVLTHGTGAINIDATRIDSPDAPETPDVSLNAKSRYSGILNGGTVSEDEPRTTSASSQGRWPSNVLLTCACDGEHDPDCPVAMLDAQSGTLKGGVAVGRNASAGQVYGNGKGLVSQSKGTERLGYPETHDGASRFFSVIRPESAPIDNGDEHPRFLYKSKPSRAERNAGLEGIEHEHMPSGRTIKPRHGDRYVPKANHHPTTKSIALMRWLVKLVTPPNGTVLDCFMGSGTTGCASVLEGCNFIGIEQDASYVEISAKRIEHWRRTVGMGGLPLFAGDDTD